MKSPPLEERKNPKLPEEIKTKNSETNGKILNSSGGVKLRMSLLVPNLYLNSVTDISNEILKNMGVTGIVLDVDDTLAPPGILLPKNIITSWVTQLQNSNIKIILASNNFKKRVNLIAENLNLECRFFVCKPLPWGIKSISKKFEIPPNEIAVVGDQIFTDILAANLAGMKSILINPLSEAKSLTLKTKRYFEKPLRERFLTQNSGGKLEK